MLFANIAQLKFVKINVELEIYSWYVDIYLLEAKVCIAMTENLNGNKWDPYFSFCSQPHYAVHMGHATQK